VLTAAIIARDEADRIGDAIRSVAFADEVLVLDSGSTDGTPDRARDLGARVELTDWPGHVAQKNRALAMASHPWVLSIDADERVTAPLAREIAALLPAAAAPGYRLRRVEHWLGHRVQGGAFAPRHHLRLVRRDRAVWTGRDPHDVLAVDGATEDLAGDLDHFPYRDFSEHLRTIDRYTRIDARHGSVVDALARPPWHFFRTLFLQRGYRDGAAGVALSALGALYVLCKHARYRWDPAVAAELGP
jgi:glycosyltransferase involved in cell wall biosynthesis